jgi:hypothetical protein
VQPLRRGVADTSIVVSKDGETFASKENDELVIIAAFDSHR